MIISDDQYANQEIVGKILKAQRNSLSLSQRNIAQKLKYRNLNYISQIEAGVDKIPFKRLLDFCDAYQLDRSFSLVMLRLIYSSEFNSFLIISEIMQNIKKSQEIEKWIILVIEDLVKEFNINLLS